MLETDCFYLFEVTAQDRAMVPDDPVVNDSEKLPEFRQLSSEDVRRLVQRSAKKTVYFVGISISNLRIDGSTLLVASWIIRASL